MCLACLRQNNMGTRFSSEGKKAHGEIGTGNSHLTNGTSLRKFTGKILTLHLLRSLTFSEKKVLLV